MPPQSNATLSRVTGATAATGGRDEWFGDAPTTGPGAAGALKWEGSARAYLTDDVRRMGPDVSTGRVLYIDSAVALAAGIDTDDVLTVTPDGGAPFATRASTIAVRRLAGIPSELQTARLELAST